MKTTKEKEHVYFRVSTTSQRNQFLKLVNEDGLTVKAASIKSKMSRGSYYYWLPRFKAEGYAGLEKCKSKAPKNHGRKKSKILVSSLTKVFQHLYFINSHIIKILIECVSNIK